MYTTKATTIAQRGGPDLPSPGDFSVFVTIIDGPYMPSQLSFAGADTVSWIESTTAVSLISTLEAEPTYSTPDTKSAASPEQLTRQSFGTEAVSNTIPEWSPIDSVPYYGASTQPSPHMDTLISRTTTRSPVPSPTQTAYLPATEFSASSRTNNSRSLQITTTFTPPQQCWQSLTMLGTKHSEIWYNEPAPASGRTYSQCYDSAFMTSYLEAIRGTSLPPFASLVCQFGWITAFQTPVSDGTYIICCPR